MIVKTSTTRLLVLGILFQSSIVLGESATDRKVDFNNVYLKNIDPDISLYPLAVFPLYTVILYKDTELSDYWNLTKTDIAKIEVVGRRKRGYPIFSSSGGVRYSNALLEVYKVQVSLTDWGTKFTVKGKKSLDGFVKAEDVYKKDEKIVSPSGNMTVWISKFAGCRWYEPGQSYYDLSALFLEYRNGVDGWFLGVSGRGYFGLQTEVFWSPGDKYIMVNSFNHIENYNTAIYSDEGTLCWKSSRYLTSPNWLVKKQIVFLRGIGEDDSVYEAQLNTGGTKNLFRFDKRNEGWWVDEGEGGDGILKWSPVSYNEQTNTITSIFKRRKAGLTSRTYIIEFDANGTIVSESYTDKKENNR